MYKVVGDVKRNLLNLINSKKSLDEISKIMGLGKTTVYYHLKKIMGLKRKPVRINTHNKELIGEVIGFFAGDGSYFNDKKKWHRGLLFHFNLKELKVIDYYYYSIKKLVGYFPTKYNGKSTTTIKLSRGEVIDFILSYVKFGKKKVKTIELKDKSLLRKRNFVSGFLRGLTDSDGYVRKGRKEIYFGSISHKLFKDYLNGLNFFEFEYKTYIQKREEHNDFYKVRLTGKEVDRFNKLIKPIKRLHGPIV